MKNGSRTSSVRITKQRRAKGSSPSLSTSHPKKTNTHTAKNVSTITQNVDSNTLSAFPHTGSDAPGWSRKRAPFVLPDNFRLLRPVDGTRGRHVAELHCHSHFSFLDGASSPEDLVLTAAQLGYSAIGLTDHNGFYGVVRFAEAAKAVGMATVFGAEITLGTHTARTNIPDPHGSHLILLARSPAGYQHLSAALATAAMRVPKKGEVSWQWEDLAALCATGTVAVLTGCRKGVVPRALLQHGHAAARLTLEHMQHVCGSEHVFVELWHHNDPHDDERNDALYALARTTALPIVATNNVHGATRQSLRLGNVVAAIRASCSLDDLNGWLPSHRAAYLRHPSDIVARFARYEPAVSNAAALAQSCAFDLSLVAPQLPDCDVPGGETPASYLRTLVMAGAHQRYGPVEAERVAGAYAQLDCELKIIEQLDFPGYFLVVHDIVQFCRRADILCQGRGSAANSAVCYALGITNVDAVSLRLLFERFLSPEREGPPDIDIDVESGRREEVIQYIYNRYGRQRAAQVCNVITYRPRSALRDAARAFGYAPGQQDAWAKKLDAWARLTEGPIEGVPEMVSQYAETLQDVPRHLGIHSGGMVLCDRPIATVCPTEWARMENRSVLQWDKDDCAAMGLVKFDILGLGMLSMLRHASDAIRTHFDATFDLARLPQDDAVYDMLCEGDALGVFQVESRAQLTTLPRIRPRTFYDLVIEIALIRPGPIQGGSVHPYLRRRNGQEAVTYLHPLLRPALEKTLGVPLFQEQLMQMAIDAAGFSPTDADELRVSLGAKRSAQRMGALRQRLLDGMQVRDVPKDVAEQVFEKIAAFANYGFPESHAVSFAFLVYASAWIKRFYPQCFLIGLLNAQPMGFWSPRSLIADAERHGVVVMPPDVNASASKARVVDKDTVRMGLSSLDGFGDDVVDALVNAQPFASLEDIARTGLLSLKQLETLSISGACASLGIDRREALWMAGVVQTAAPRHGQLSLPGMTHIVMPDKVAAMTPFEETLADLSTFGASPGRSLLSFFREELDAQGIVRACDLVSHTEGKAVAVAGLVTHRQRPATAHGITFVNVEDETGMSNVVCSLGFWKRYRNVASTQPAVVVRGILKKERSVTTLTATHMWPLLERGKLSHDLAKAVPARNFR